MLFKSTCPDDPLPQIRIADDDKDVEQTNNISEQYSNLEAGYSPRLQPKLPYGGHTFLPYRQIRPASLAYVEFQTSRVKVWLYASKLTFFTLQFMWE